jgi:hypothetical protein
VGLAAPVFGLEQTYNVISPMPIIFFAVLFGLSVDYEVFLISRIREEYDASGDPLESVARGVAATGRVITAAALIMTAVFMAFVLNPAPLIMMIGIGLGTAIIVDATIVRMVLVPASMALLGRANWWLPAVLDRHLPRIAAHARSSSAADGRAGCPHDRAGVSQVASARTTVEGASQHGRPLRALVQHRYGGPDVLRTAEVPLPTPGPGPGARPGRRQLGQRPGLARDARRAAGRAPPRPQPLRPPGASDRRSRHGLRGTVDAVGPDVTRWDPVTGSSVRPMRPGLSTSSRPRTPSRRTRRREPRAGSGASPGRDDRADLPVRRPATGR